jgi:SsrA-binding protein
VSGISIKNNKYARFSYTIEETYEAGIVLSGKDVKAIRSNKFEIRDAFVRVEGNELFLWNIIFFEEPDKIHKRKLLLNRKEINKIISYLKDKKKHGYVLGVRYNPRRHIKFDLGFGVTKKHIDQKSSDKRTSEKRTLERELKIHYDL